jgi:hypothetical protein
LKWSDKSETEHDCLLINPKRPDITRIEGDGVIRMDEMELGT